MYDFIDPLNSNITLLPESHPNPLLLEREEEKKRKEKSRT